MSGTILQGWVFQPVFYSVEFHANYLPGITIRPIFKYTYSQFPTFSTMFQQPTSKKYSYQRCGMRCGCRKSRKWKQSRLDCKTLLQNNNCIKVREIIQLKAFFPKVDYHYHWNKKVMRASTHEAVGVVMNAFISSMVDICMLNGKLPLAEVHRYPIFVSLEEHHVDWF